MSLAPLANVFAYSDPDPSVVAKVADRLRATTKFTAVWEPAASWIAASAPLPGVESNDAAVRRAGLAFAEGRQVAEDPGGVAAGIDARRYDFGGDVGMVRFRAAGEATVVRSAAGLVPWYVWTSGSSAAVATLVTDMARFVPHDLALDPLPNAMWASFIAAFPDRRTFLSGVEAVAPGAAAVMVAGRPVHHEAWWDPWPDAWVRPSRARREQHVARFREEVLASLRAGLDPAGGNLLTLSGGVDSTLLAAVIAGHLGLPLSALSLVPEGEGPIVEREWSYLAPIVEEFGISPHLTRPFSAACRLEMAGRGPEVAFPVLHPALQLLPEAMEQTSVTVLVGGEFADEVSGGEFAFADWREAVGPSGLLRQWGRWPHGRSDLRTWAGWVRRGKPLNEPWPGALSTIVRPEVKAEYQSWRFAESANLANDPRPHRHLRALLGSLEGVTAMNWEACSALRVRRLFPFLTRGVLELVAECYPTELLGPGTKRLERQAFAGMVPARNLRRPDKGSFRPTRSNGQPVRCQRAPDHLTPIVRREVLDGTWQGAAHEAAGLASLIAFASTTAKIARRRGNDG